MSRDVPPNVSLAEQVDFVLVEFVASVEGESCLHVTDAFLGEGKPRFVERARAGGEK